MAASTVKEEAVIPSLADFVAALFPDDDDGAAAADGEDQRGAALAALERIDIRTAADLGGGAADAVAFERRVLATGLVSSRVAGRLRVGVESWQASGKGQRREPGVAWWASKKNGTLSLEQMDAKRRTVELRLAAELDRWRTEAALRDAAEAKLDSAYRDLEEAQAEAEDLRAAADRLRRERDEAEADKATSGAERAACVEELRKSVASLESSTDERTRLQRSLDAARRELALKTTQLEQAARKRERLFAAAAVDRDDATRAAYAAGLAREQARADEIAGQLDQTLRRWEADQRACRDAVDRQKSLEAKLRRSNVDRETLLRDREDLESRAAAYDGLPLPPAELERRLGDLEAERDRTLEEARQAKLALKDAEAIATKYADSAVAAANRCRKAEARRDEAMRLGDAATADKRQVGLKCDEAIFERNAAIRLSTAATRRADDLAAQLLLAGEEQATLRAAVDRLRDLSPIIAALATESREDKALREADEAARAAADAKKYLAVIDAHAKTLFLAYAARQEAAKRKEADSADSADSASTGPPAKKAVADVMAGLLLLLNVVEEGPRRRTKPQDAAADDDDDAGEEQPTIFPLVRLMRDRAGDRDVAWRGARALNDWARTSRPHRVSVVAVGGLGALLDALSQFPGDSDVAAHVARALGTLCFESDAHRSLIADCGGLDALASALQAASGAMIRIIAPKTTAPEEDGGPASDEFIQVFDTAAANCCAKICAAVVNLAHNSEANRALLARHPARPVACLVDLLLRVGATPALRDESNAAVLAQAALVFSTLAVSDAAALVLVRHKAHHAVATAMAELPDHAGLQTHGCAALANLKLGPHRNALCDVPAADLARVALAKFGHVSQLAHHAEILLKDDDEYEYDRDSGSSDPRLPQSNGDRGTTKRPPKLKPAVPRAAAHHDLVSSSLKAHSPYVVAGNNARPSRHDASA